MARLFLERDYLNGAHPNGHRYAQVTGPLAGGTADRAVDNNAQVTRSLVTYLASAGSKDRRGGDSVGLSRHQENLVHYAYRDTEQRAGGTAERSLI